MKAFFLILSLICYLNAFCQNTSLWYSANKSEIRVNMNRKSRTSQIAEKRMRREKSERQIMSKALTNQDLVEKKLDGKKRNKTGSKFSNPNPKRFQTRNWDKYYTRRKISQYTVNRYANN